MLRRLESSSLGAVSPLKRLTKRASSGVSEKVRARDASTKRVRKVTGVTGPARSPLIALTQEVLAGKQSVDVTVNGLEFRITRLQVMGGSDYAITSRSRVVGNRAFSTVVDAAVPG